MLQFDIALYRARNNVAGKLRRYTHSFVAPEPVSDVKRLFSHRVHVALIHNNQVRLWRISAFLPEASWGGYPAEASYEIYATACLEAPKLHPYKLLL